jgi:hypothetical protein
VAFGANLITAAQACLGGVADGLFHVLAGRADRGQSSDYTILGVDAADAAPQAKALRRGGGMTWNLVRWHELVRHGTGRT